MDAEQHSKNPYEVLGVPNGSSIEVCKATYKSLVRIYHPDVFVGDRDFAENRMTALNEAFEFLNDPRRKKVFDEQDASENHTKKETEYSPERDSDEFYEASKILQESWDFACKFHPEIVSTFQELDKLNSQLGFLFKATIIDGQHFKKAKTIAKELEDIFLRSKFSDDRDLKYLAKFAILNNKIKFAQDLNKALKILGVNSKKQIIETLVQEYPEFAAKALKELRLFHLIPKNYTKAQEKSQDVKEPLKKLDFKQLFFTFVVLFNFLAIAIFPFGISQLFGSIYLSSLLAIYILYLRNYWKILISIPIISWIASFVIFNSNGLSGFSIAILVDGLIWVIWFA